MAAQHSSSGSQARKERLCPRGHELPRRAHATRKHCQACDSQAQDMREARERWARSDFAGQRDGRLERLMGPGAYAYPVPENRLSRPETPPHGPELPKILPNREFSGDSKFWNLIGLADGDACWPWLGSKDSKGYGRIWLNGRNFQAHRLSYAINVGEITSGIMVLHRCDNPPCCNPAHLWLGTHLDNMADMRAKWRHRSLNKQQVAEIQARFQGSSVRLRDMTWKLARKYGVSTSTIRSARKAASCSC